MQPERARPESHREYQGNSDIAAKVDFHVDIPEGFTVRCDPHHMEQVIFNLVKNGVEAVEKVEPPESPSGHTNAAIQ